MSWRNRSWNDERTELLKKLWSEGHSASVIAFEINDARITRSAVCGKARRLGLEERKSSTCRRYPAERRTAPRRVYKYATAEEAEEARRIKQREYAERHRRKNAAIQIPRLRMVAREGRLLEPLNIHFADLQRDMCRFPQDDEAQFYCGRPQEHGTSYCDDCCRIAFNERGYEAVINRKTDPLRKPLGGYVARPFEMPPAGGEVYELCEVPFS
jgi:GcrA cell cycle regulator